MARQVEPADHIRGTAVSCEIGTKGAQSMTMASFRTLIRLVPVLGLLVTPILRAQSLIESSGPSGLVGIFNEDSAVLEAQEPRKDLPCGVNPIKPQLGFDMKFHAGYEISIPLRELSGAEDLLTTIFRLTPENKKDEPIYFSQRISDPAIDPDALGNAYLQGYYDIVECKYHVVSLIRVRTERVGSSYL